ncbi:hypothetical protein ACFX2J_034712 [Malus domestica]
MSKSSSKPKHKSKSKSKSTTSSKGPPLFYEFGRKAKDLLTTGYSKGQKFSFSSRSGGEAICVKYNLKINKLLGSHI